MASDFRVLASDFVLRTSNFPGGAVHRGVREAIRVGVERSADVLERDPSDFVRQQPGLCVQRLKARVLHLVVAEHLLNEQERIRTNVHRLVLVRARPFERREQGAIFRDVVRGHADRL